MPPSLLFATGVVALFLAVFLVAFSIQALVVERRQAYRTIQTLNAIELRPADIRARELATPVRDRILRPFYRAAVGITRRFTPVGERRSLQHKLVLAGSPAGWDADRVLASKVGGLALGLVAGVLFVLALPVPLGFRLLGLVVLCLVGFFIPNVALTNQVQRRQAQIRSDLP